MKRLFFLLVVTVMVCSSFFGHNLMSAMAEEQKSVSYNKYYTSIQIKEGDSLWAIAEHYRNHSGKSTEEYLKELKNINRLGEDIIHAGNYLTVAYYAEEEK